MAVINFLFKSPSWSLQLLESTKHTFDMMFLSQQVTSWKGPLKRTWNSLSRVDLAMFQKRLSLFVGILTKLFQQVTHPNQLPVLLGQYDFINFCNLSRLILKKGGFIPVLADHKKGIFLLKREFLCESQQPVRRLSNQFSSFRLKTN